MSIARSINPKRRRRLLAAGIFIVAAIGLGAVAIVHLVSGEVYLAIVVAMFVSAFAGMAIVGSVRYPEPGEYTPRPRTKTK